MNEIVTPGYFQYRELFVITAGVSAISIYVWMIKYDLKTLHVDADFFHIEGNLSFRKYLGTDMYTWTQSVC